MNAFVIFILVIIMLIAYYYIYQAPQSNFYSLKSGQVAGSRYCKGTLDPARQKCILPAQIAIQRCDNDSKCTGYGQDISAEFLDAYGNSYELFYDNDWASDNSWAAYSKL